jgi:putative ABC transport system substrate-binding protein
VGGYVDPVAAGVIQSLARPGGNITGLTYISEELQGKRVQLLKDVTPRLKKIGVLVEEGAPASAIGLVKLAEATRRLGLEIAAFSLRDPSEFESVIQKAKKQKVGGLYVGGTPLIAYRPNRVRLADLFIKYQLPSIGAWNYMADSGFLMGYSPHMADQYRKAAPYIDKILRGADPAEIPMEQPTKYELVVNLRTAKALGIKVPQTVLTLADRVIE